MCSARSILGAPLLPRQAPIAAEDVLDVNQTVDLWGGVAHSRFSLLGAAVAVDTAVHGEVDLVSASITSAHVARKKKEGSKKK